MKKLLGTTTNVPNNKPEGRHHRSHKPKFYPETEKPKYKAAEPKQPLCMFNEGVCCTSYAKNYSLLPNAPTCETCGWNPAVQKARNQKLAAKFDNKL